MNPSFLIGIISTALLMLLGIALNIGAAPDFAVVAGFGSLAGIIITVGGTFAALLSAFPLRYFAGIPKHFAVILGIRKNNPIFYINTLSTLSEAARKNGILALEEAVTKLNDRFMCDAVMLVVDALEPEKFRERMNIELVGIESRHTQVWGLYEKAAGLAPAFGVIGTVIGFVRMLADIGATGIIDMTQLAGTMAFAMLATLYGLLLANAVFLPIANQLRIAHETELLCKEIVVVGVLAIQAGENPRAINEKLRAYLPERGRSRAVSLDKTTTE